MDKQYQYQALMTILQGGYEGELKGVIPEDNTPHITSELTGSKTYTYWYLDSDNAVNPNANSSQVNFNVEDTWTVNIDNNNILTVRVHTKILSITRSNPIGNPSPPGWSRTIIIRRQQGGAIIQQFHDTDITTAHTISGEIDLGETTFTLQPGISAERGTFYIYNETTERPDLPKDEFQAGITFTNILPADYRPGMVWDGSAWMSCNRDGGVCQIWDGSAWVEARTLDGGTGTGNPPLSYNGSAWVNQSKIGQE